jgi:hypothetical protein
VCLFDVKPFQISEDSDGCDVMHVGISTEIRFGSPTELASVIVSF